jgi:hypothetical protein
MSVIETAVRELKDEIVRNDGRNIAGRTFTKRVDDLVSHFYDDIGEITQLSTRSLFDLFVIKVLYVERRSTDAGVLDYLGWLLERYLFTHELFPLEREGRRTFFYFSDLIEETRHPVHFQNLFEAYRKYGDNSLVISGVFSRALRKRRTRRSKVPLVDQTYFVRTGKWSYRLASEHELAEETEQRVLLEKLAAYFELYVEALSEMSDRYILGFDFNLIADKMLDSINSYRSSGEERFLENARRYAAILKLDPEAFPSIVKRARPRLLGQDQG